MLVGADLLISIADFTGEFILIYRCWLLWSKNYWIVILPSLAAIGGLGKVPLTIVGSRTDAYQLTVILVPSMCRRDYPPSIAHQSECPNRPSFRCTTRSGWPYSSVVHQRDHYHPHRRTHMASFPSQGARRAGHALPDRHGPGRDRYRRRERPDLFNRATHLCYSLCHQAPCPGRCLFDGGTDIRT